jgi:NADH pyrophosphatase NudC (nudix superfamily)
MDINYSDNINQIHRCSLIQNNEKIVQNEQTKVFNFIVDITEVLKNIKYCPYCGKLLKQNNDKKYNPLLSEKCNIDCKCHNKYEDNNCNIYNNINDCYARKKELSKEV